MPSRVEHLHRQLHRPHLVDHDGIAESDDEARRRPLASGQHKEHRGHPSASPVASHFRWHLAFHRTPIDAVALRGGAVGADRRITVSREALAIPPMILSHPNDHDNRPFSSSSALPASAAAWERLAGPESTPESKEEPSSSP